MANPVKGEVAFEAEGRTYKMVLDFNAICEADVDMANGAAMARPKAIRAVFWAALLRYQPGITLLEAGDLMASIGLAKASELITKAADLGGLVGGDGDAPARPRKPAPSSPRSRTR